MYAKVTVASTDLFLYMVLAVGGTGCGLAFYSLKMLASLSLGL
jgi:hypothetical protein